jgi:hypothetical protein
MSIFSHRGMRVYAMAGLCHNIITTEKITFDECKIATPQNILLENYQDATRYLPPARYLLSMG